MLCCVRSAGEEVDPKSLRIGRLGRRGRVGLADWLREYEASGQGRGERGSPPGVRGRWEGWAATRRGEGVGGGCGREGAGPGGRGRVPRPGAGPGNEGRPGPTGRADGPGGRGRAE